MKSPLVLALFASIFSSAISPGAVLVGFHTFDSNSLLDEDADTTTAGFTATITKNTNTNGPGGGGSNDNTYGNSSIQIGPSATDNGVYRMYGGTTSITTWATSSGWIIQSVSLSRWPPLGPEKSVATLPGMM